MRTDRVTLDLTLLSLAKNKLLASAQVVSWLPQFQERGKTQDEIQNCSTFVIWQETKSLFCKPPGNAKWAKYTSKHQCCAERRCTVRETARTKGCRFLAGEWGWSAATKVEKQGWGKRVKGRLLEAAWATIPSTWMTINPLSNTNSRVWKDRCPSPSLLSPVVTQSSIHTFPPLTAVAEAWKGPIYVFSVTGAY